ncbi:MAG TPA: hypothetical protein VGS23_09015 [Thermoplasmata archaeon]|nr:hypothetical protein [Thermoplasmata archaeon]
MTLRRIQALNANHLYAFMLSYTNGVLKLTYMSTHMLTQGLKRGR